MLVSNRNLLLRMVYFQRRNFCLFQGGIRVSSKNRLKSSPPELPYGQVALNDVVPGFPNETQRTYVGDRETLRFSAYATTLQMIYVP